MGGAARDHWSDEMEAIYLYRVLAEVEPAPERREMFARLAEEASGQAAVWAEEMRGDGDPAADSFVPSRRARTVAQLVRRLGPMRMRGVLSAMKVRGMSVYRAPLEGHPMPHSVKEIGRSHRGAGGGNLRAIVFGANDGLVSNASLILGVAGATSDTHVVMLSGAAGLLAGALSMASGEYVSMRSQREMFERQIEAEREELKQYPAAEAAELSLIYQARGLAREDADKMATGIVAHPDYALDTLAREELGLDPSALGSPIGAAVSSLISFAIGAVIPLAPFLVGAGHNAIAATVALTAAALFGVGAAISLFTGRGALRGGLRMLLIGGGAAATTYLVGRAFGVATG